MKKIHDCRMFFFSGIAAVRPSKPHPYGPDAKKLKTWENVLTKNWQTM